MDNNKNGRSFADVPLGFGMALAKNVNAMEAFARMSEAERQSVINRAHQVKSKQEMQQFVDGLASHVNQNTNPNSNPHTNPNVNQFK